VACGSGRRAAVCGRFDRFDGTLIADGTSVPVAFEASVRLIDGELEVEATTTVDQSRLGMSRGPLRNVRPPAKLHVKARVVPEPPA
jgi:hypothetical protein